MQESIESNLARERGLHNVKDFLQTKEGGKQFARFEFSQDKYSNGETTMKILEYNIEPEWSEFENVRYFYEFFKNRKKEFEK